MAASAMSGGDDEDDGLPGICEGSFDACAAAAAADNGFISPEEEEEEGRAGQGRADAERGRDEVAIQLGQAVKLRGGGGGGGGGGE